MSNHESMFLEHNPEFEAENFLFEQHEQPEFEYESFLFEQHEHGEGEVFGETELMELAGELMEINSEAELDRFLGKVFSGIKKFANSSIGRAVGGALKGLAKKALPLAGTVAGGFFGGPLGAKIGGGLARVAANALEMETLEAEDREFEGAKNFVRICGEAAKKALAASPNANPTVVAQKAVTAAVAKHAPGLMGKTAAASRSTVGRQTSALSSAVRGQSGRWVRKGNSIVLLNAA